MKRLTFGVALLIASQLVFAAPGDTVGPTKPVEVTNEVTVNGSVEVSNTPDVIVANGQNNPVPVTVTDQSGESLFVFERTVTFSQGDNRAARDLFTVPPGKTLLIEYINTHNADANVGPDGQETSLHVNYSAVGGSLGDFPGASHMFESKSEVQDRGGAKVFLPVPTGAVVRATVEIRDAAPFTSSYRVTVAGRLLETPVQGPFD